MNNKFYIETMGCQMNKLDSELVINQLGRLGYERTDNIDDAEVIIYNTCSVRQHAEDKVISKIGQLGKRHRREKGLVLAVIGCMAQRWGKELPAAYRQVDIVCGPGRLHQLGELIEAVRRRGAGGRQVVLNDPAEAANLEELDTCRQRDEADASYRAYLRIMRGCNNYCSYCVVPYVRGPEVSRPLAHILEEAQRLVRDGVKEITLLGQAVNHYSYRLKGRVLVLADVLEALAGIEGLFRLRFVTSYPHNFDIRVLELMRDLPNVCPYLHVCAQSGSDRILQAMNRRYTVGEYLELIERGREIVPDFSVAGDFIVGFPGETEDDFQATMDLVRKVHYKNCFIFRYSPRPGTRAAGELADDVPLAVKQRRNQELLDLVNSIALQDNQKFVGRTVEVLVEGPSKKPHLDGCDGVQLVGRTGGDHIVVFAGPVSLTGQIIPVMITRASSLTLFGEVV